MNELLVVPIAFVGKPAQFPPEVAVPVDRHVLVGSLADFAVVAEVSVVVEAEPLMLPAVLGASGENIDECPGQTAP
jgi:hypothetical protein